MICAVKYKIDIKKNIKYIITNYTMDLSREQQIAFDKYIQGKNIFITGPGGTGKSALIKKIYEHAYKSFKDIK